MTKGKFSVFLALLLLSASTCWARDSSFANSQDMAIHTWGGGALLEKVFQSISMLIYGNSKSGIDQTFTSIIRISLSIGGFCAICLAFMREKFEPLIKNFFLPGVIIINCILVPRTTIKIDDHLAQKSSSAKERPMITVEKIPYFLGKLAEVISTVSFKLTNALEGVAHGNNDQIYNWTGHIYAGENIFLTKKCRIANPILEENFREFCRECVFRDLGLGIYSKDELIHSHNILEFLKNNTSRIRTVKYRETLENNPHPEAIFLPCRDAMTKMYESFNKKPGNAKEILIGEIGNGFQYLLKQKDAGQNNLQNLIKQQIAINTLKEEIPGSLNSFAAKRAELLQRENQKILGALGASTIVALRNYFEATLYMVFPLIIIVSLLSFGLKTLLNWLHAIIWVNTWPIFYVVTQFMLSSIWDLRTKNIFGDNFGLTVFTSEGLADLYASMESIAAATLASIPFLSWMLIKGGVSQMIQLASSITAPAQSAASTASAEKTYGNYSYGNVSLDNVNGYNAQTFRQTYSGLLSTGSVSVDSGTETMTYSPSSDSLYIKQSDSYLREGISRTQAFGNAVQNSLTTSQSALKESSKGYSESLADTTNKAVGFVESISNQYQKGDNFSTQNTTALQEAAQFIQGMGNDYALSKGVSNDQAMREVVSAGIGFSLGLKGSFDGSYQDGISKSESESLVAKGFDSESFQKHLQTILNASSGESGNILKGEDARLHDDLSLSFNRTKSSSEQWRAAYAESEAISNLESYSNSDNVSFHQNLNQRFVDFLTEKYQDIGKVNEMLEMPSESSTRYALIQEFVNDFLPTNALDKSIADIKATYNQYAFESKTIDRNTYEQNEATFIQAKETELNHHFGETEQAVNALKSKVEQQSNNRVTSIQTDREKIHQQYDSRKQSTEQSTEKSIGSHFLDKATSIKIAPTAILGASRAVYNQLFGPEEEPRSPGG